MISQVPSHTLPGATEEYRESPHSGYYNNIKVLSATIIQLKSFKTFLKL
jgi:hypothetical protein